MKYHPWQDPNLLILPQVFLTLAKMFMVYQFTFTIAEDVSKLNFFLYPWLKFCPKCSLGPDTLDILRGHSRATMFLICNNAAQGILSSFFFKYAGEASLTYLASQVDEMHHVYNPYNHPFLYHKILVFYNSVVCGSRLFSP